MEHTPTFSDAEVDVLASAMNAYADEWFTGKESKEFCETWASAYRKVMRMANISDEVIERNMQHIFGGLI